MLKMGRAGSRDRCHTCDISISIRAWALPSWACAALHHACCTLVELALDRWVANAGEGDANEHAVELDVVFVLR